MRFLRLTYVCGVVGYIAWVNTLRLPFALTLFHETTKAHTCHHGRIKIAVFCTGAVAAVAKQINNLESTSLAFVKDPEFHTELMLNIGRSRPRLQNSKAHECPTPVEFNDILRTFLVLPSFWVARLVIFKASTWPVLQYLPDSLYHTQA